MVLEVLDQAAEMMAVSGWCWRCLSLELEEAAYRFVVQEFPWAAAGPVKAVPSSAVPKDQPASFRRAFFLAERVPWLPC